MNGIQEVSGSIPLISTKENLEILRNFKVFCYPFQSHEGSRLTHDETRLIYETNTIGLKDKAVDPDDLKLFAVKRNCGHPKTKDFSEN